MAKYPKIRYFVTLWISKNNEEIKQTCAIEVAIDKSIINELTKRYPGLKNVSHIRELEPNEFCYYEYP